MNQRLTLVSNSFVCLFDLSVPKKSQVRKDHSPPSIHHARPSIFNISQCNMTDLAGSHRGETFLTLQPQRYLKITYISQHGDMDLCWERNPLTNTSRALILLTISPQSSLLGNSLIETASIILPAGASGLKVQRFN